MHGKHCQSATYSYRAFPAQRTSSLKTCKNIYISIYKYSLCSGICFSAADSLLKKPEGDEKDAHEGKHEVCVQLLLLPRLTPAHLCKGTGLVEYEEAI